MAHRELKVAPGERVRSRLRYRYAAWRYPALRGADALQLGPGAHLMIADEARIQIGPGLISRRDLTLLVWGELDVGNGLFCNRGVLLAAMQRVTIGDYVRIAERVSIMDHNHVIEPLDDLRTRFDEYETAPVTIGDRVLIGANCVILPGVTIGDDAVIGAGSIVTRDIPAGTLALGIPAEPRRTLKASESPAAPSESSPSPAEHAM